MDLVVAYSKLVNGVRSTASADLSATMQLQTCGGIAAVGCVPSSCSSGNPIVATIVQRALIEMAAVPLTDVSKRTQIACCAVYQLIRSITVQQFNVVVSGLIGCTGPLASYLLPSPESLAAALCALIPYLWNLSPTLVQCVNGANSSCSGQRGSAALFKLEARAAFPCELLRACSEESSGVSFLPPGPVMTGFTIVLNLFNSALDCRMTSMTATVNHAEIVAETRGNFPLVQLAACALQYPYSASQ